MLKPVLHRGRGAREGCWAACGSNLQAVATACGLRAVGRRRRRRRRRGCAALVAPPGHRPHAAARTDVDDHAGASGAHSSPHFRDGGRAGGPRTCAPAAKYTQANNGPFKGELRVVARTRGRSNDARRPHRQLLPVNGDQNRARETAILKGLTRGVSQAAPAAPVPARPAAACRLSTMGVYRAGPSARSSNRVLAYTKWEKRGGWGLSATQGVSRRELRGSGVGELQQKRQQSVELG